MRKPDYPGVDTTLTMHYIQLPDWRNDKGERRIADDVICMEEDDWSSSNVTSAPWKNCWFVESWERSCNSCMLSSEKKK